jgi:hypothetical protein
MDTSETYATRALPCNSIVEAEEIPTGLYITVLYNIRLAMIPLNVQTKAPEDKLRVRAQGSKIHSRCQAIIQ